MEEAPSSSPRGYGAQKCGTEAGSSQTLSQCLLWTSETVVQKFTEQEQQPADRLPTLHRGCTQNWVAALPLGKASPKGSRGCERWFKTMREAAPVSKPTAIAGKGQEREEEMCQSDFPASPPPLILITGSVTVGRTV